jgi:hypothetical protein
MNKENPQENPPPITVETTSPSGEVVTTTPTSGGAAYISKEVQDEIDRRNKEKEEAELMKYLRRYMIANILLHSSPEVVNRLSISELSDIVATTNISVTFQDWLKIVRS